MAKKITSKKNKADLIVAIQHLLQTKTVGTQERIQEALQRQGFKVNQVKISRILHKIGAIKMTEGGQIVYRLPTEIVSIRPSDSLKQLILKVDHNESVIVIQTSPGSAQLIARFLDTNDGLDILGSVAGDDTIFVAPVKTKQIKELFQKIYHLLLG